MKIIKTIKIILIILSLPDEVLGPVMASINAGKKWVEYDKKRNERSKKNPVKRR